MQNIVNLRTVCACLTVSRSKLIKMIEAKTFPAPVKINGKCCWLDTELALMVSALISGMDKNDLAETCLQIENNRVYKRDSELKIKQDLKNGAVNNSLN